MRWLALMAVGSASTLAVSATAHVPVAVKASARFLERAPVADGPYLAWAQSSDTRAHFDVLVQRGSGRPFVANAPGTQGRPGGIAGRTLAFQQWRGRRSDIELLDLSTRRRFEPPSGVNTRQWEYRPLLSGDWLLFGRRNLGTGVETVLLQNLRTGEQVVLDRSDRSAGPPRFGPRKPLGLAGRYAVWIGCPRSPCGVFRYDIATRETRPNYVSGVAEAHIYAASVVPNGSLYALVSGTLTCRADGRAELWRFDIDGSMHWVRGFTQNDPVEVYARSDEGATDVYFSRGPCRGEDIYKLTDSAPATSGR